MQNDWWSGLSYMYRGRSWSYNEVSQYVPWRQTGWVEVYVYWYLNLAVDGCGWAVCPDHFMATGKALVFIELEAEWALELAWIFWRKGSSLAASKIWTPNLLVYILVIVLTDHAAPYWFEGHTKVHINKLRWDVGIGSVWFMTGIPGNLLWT